MGNCGGSPASKPAAIHSSKFPSVLAGVANLTSLHGWYAEQCTKHGDKVAYVDAVTGRELTYSGISKTVAVLRAVLYSKYNVRQGDNVLILAPNFLEYTAAVMAVMSLGAVVSPCNPLFDKNDVAKHMGIVGATDKVVISLSPMAASLPDGTVAFFVDKLDEIEDEHKNPDAVPADYKDGVTADSVCCTPSSSGTTGLQKAVKLTCKNIVTNVLQCDAVLKLTGDDVLLQVLPSFHIYAFTIHGLMAAYAGTRTLVLSKFDPAVYLRAIVEQKANVLFIAPPIATFMAKHPSATGLPEEVRKNVRLIVSGAAPLSVEIQKMVAQVFPAAFVGGGWGLSECSPVLSATAAATTTTTDDQSHFGTVGQIVPDTLVRVCAVNDDGSFNESEAKEQGEFVVAGPQVMQGYKLEKDNATVFVTFSDDKAKRTWLRTGDIGKIDDKGQIVILDRCKELIKVSGFQVAPAELENLLLSHDSVADVLVVGIPDDKVEGNELPRAWVVLKPTAKVGDAEGEVNETAICEFVKNNAVYYKQLKGGVKFVDAVPKAASGKLLRRVVRDQERAEFAERQEQQKKEKEVEEEEKKKEAAAEAAAPASAAEAEPAPAAAAENEPTAAQ